MIPRFFVHLTTVLFVFGSLSTSLAFPSDVDLLKRQEVDDTTARPGGGPGVVDPPPPPGPPSFTGAKLVNDRGHPWRPLRNGDERGPCPGMNTLASHGVSVAQYLHAPLTHLFEWISISLAMVSPRQVRWSPLSRKVGLVSIKGLMCGQLAHFMIRIQHGEQVRDLRDLLGPLI